MARVIEDIVADLQAAGCEFYLGGPQWVRILPPPPVELLLEIVGRGDDLHDYITRNKLYAVERPL